LGSCNTAPMMQLGDQYYHNLTKDKVVEIVERREKEGQKEWLS